MLFRHRDVFVLSDPATNIDVISSDVLKGDVMQILVRLCPISKDVIQQTTIAWLS